MIYRKNEIIRSRYSGDEGSGHWRYDCYLGYCDTPEDCYKQISLMTGSPFERIKEDIERDGKFWLYMSQGNIVIADEYWINQ